MTMEKLAEPTRDLAEKVLNEVGFEDRIIGYRLRERSGLMSITLYSFEEVVVLLYDSNPRIDFNRLEMWIRETMGDGELAGKVKQVIEKDISDQEKSFAIRDLMLERLLQCKKVV